MSKWYIWIKVSCFLYFDVLFLNLSSVVCVNEDGEIFNILEVCLIFKLSFWYVYVKVFVIMLVGNSDLFIILFCFIE